MSTYKSMLVILSLFFIIDLACSTEFVPVYMWSTSKASERVSALHRISQDSFKDDVLEHLKGDPFVIVFAEQTLSPEDFIQRDQSGGMVFPYLSKVKGQARVTYFPYVQHPIRALKHLDEEVAELSITALRENLEIPDSKILIVDLNDAKDDEHRVEMLKRHDADIKSVYEEICKKHKNVLALYTAHHTSWVAPEGIINSRRTRSLLQAADSTVEPRSYFNSTYTLLYFTNITFIANKSVSTNQTEVNMTFSDAITDGEIVLTGSSTEGLQVVFTFTSSISVGYWNLKEATATYENNEYNLTGSISDIYAPLSFSYHCGDLVLTDSANFQLDITYFQVQPFFSGTGNTTKFSDAYDCVGFTTVPIWSGLFVTSILLLIMTFGITMMMDIRTMDRFDDAKGKTITVTAE